MNSVFGYSILTFLSDNELNREVENFISAICMTQKLKWYRGAARVVADRFNKMEMANFLKTS